MKGLPIKPGPTTTSGHGVTVPKAAPAVRPNVSGALHGVHHSQVQARRKSGRFA
jgi:hypothetical protein